MTDYRRHLYKYVPSTRLLIDEWDIETFVEDPIDFFQSFGYYYVAGITTGSSFEGSLNYKSEDKRVLQEVSNNAISGW